MIRHGVKGVKNKIALKMKREASKKYVKEKKKHAQM